MYEGQSSWEWEGCPTGQEDADNGEEWHAWNLSCEEQYFLEQEAV